MVPNNLADVFGTVAIGLLTVLVIAALRWVSKNPEEDYFDWLAARPWMPKEKNTFSGLLMVLLAFSIGVVTEGTTDYMTDVETDFETSQPILRPFFWFQGKLTWLMGKEEEHRFRTMFKRGDDGYELTGIGRETFGTRKTWVVRVLGDSRFALAPEKFLNEDLEPKVSAERREVAVKGVQRLYYPAKNWAYTHPNHFVELERVQRRIDWSRSFFLIGAYGLVAVFVLGVVARVRRSKSAGDSVNMARARFAKRTGLLGALLALLCACSNIAYSHSESQFNERAFGYFLSHLGRSDVATAKAPQDGLRWMRSAEYRAQCIQAYSQAFEALEALKANHDARPEGATKPPAVVLDVDDTVLRTVEFNAYLDRYGMDYSDGVWQAWIESRSEPLEPVPGVKEFLGRARDLGVTPVFITNRPSGLQGRTIQDLVARGLAARADLEIGNLLMRTDGSSKESRREKVEERFDVLLLVGDNLADFAKTFEWDEAGTVQRRNRFLEDNDKAIGTRWFVIPNPVYGDWSRVTDSADLKHDDES